MREGKRIEVAKIPQTTYKIKWSYFSFPLFPFLDLIPFTPSEPKAPLVYGQIK